jgi:hypothetical protein
MRVTSYDVYIDSDREEEFRELVSKTFGNAIELNWKDVQEV